MDAAFKYVIANGIATEAEYPYLARNGTCKTEGMSRHRISSYADVEPYN